MGSDVVYKVTGLTPSPYPHCVIAKAGISTIDHHPLIFRSILLDKNFSDQKNKI
jgi:hypothetical protein